MSYKSSKLFNIKDRKRQTGIPTTEVDVFQWKSTLLEELRKNSDFSEHLAPGATWGQAKELNRGFKGEDSDTKAKAVEALLTKIASYAPRCLVKSINKRTTCLEDIWTLLRDWAGIQNTGSKHLDYFRVKRSWNDNGDETKQEFFYRLKDSMEDTLVSREDQIFENGKLISVDEELTPCINSIVVMDWIEAIGGPSLVEHIYRSYAKDLETNTLGSLQTRISKNLEALLIEMQEFEQAKVNRVAVKSPHHVSQSFSRSNRSVSLKPQRSTSHLSQNYHSRSSSNNRLCKICNSANHYISACPQLTEADRSAIAKFRAVQTDDVLEYIDEDSTTDHPKDDYEEPDQD